MNYYKFDNVQLDILVQLMDGYLKQKGMQAIYIVLEVLKQLESKNKDGEYYLVQFNQFHLDNLNVIFDVNLRAYGFTLYTDLSSIISVLKNPEKIEEEEVKAKEEVSEE